MRLSGREAEVGEVDVEVEEGVGAGGGAGVGSRVEVVEVVGLSQVVLWGARLGRSECERSAPARWRERRLGRNACEGLADLAIDCLQPWKAGHGFILYVLAAVRPALKLSTCMCACLAREGSMRQPSA